MEEAPDILTADLVIASQDYLPDSTSSGSDTEGSVYVCGIVIINRPIAFPVPAHDSVQTTSDEPASSDAEPSAPEQSHLDTVAMVFAPGSLPGGKATHAVRILQMGDATLSCPQGKCEC